MLKLSIDTQGGHRLAEHTEILEKTVLSAEVHFMTLFIFYVL